MAKEPDALLRHDSKSLVNDGRGGDHFERENGRKGETIHGPLFV